MMTRLLLLMFVCAYSSSCLMGLKTHFAVVNRITFSTSMFVKIDPSTGSTSKLHYINLAPIMSTFPQNFVQLNNSTSIVLNFKQAPLKSCSWGLTLHCSSSQGPAFTDFVAGAGSHVFGIESAFQEFNLESGRATAFGNNLPGMFVVGMDTINSNQIMAITSTGLFNTTQWVTILDISANKTTSRLLSPSELSVATYSIRSSDGMVGAVIRNTTFVDVRYGWSFGFIDLKTATVSSKLELPNFTGTLLPPVYDGGNIHLFDKLTISTITSSYSLQPPVQIQGFGSGDQLDDAKMTNLC